MKYKLIIFDWDGTLMDSSDLVVRSMQNAAADFNLPVLEPKAITNMIGISLEKATSTLFPELAEQECLAVVNRFREHYFADEKVSLFPQVKETVDELRARGYLLSIATGKSRMGLNKDLSHTGIGPYFSASRTAHETAEKPHPKMLHEILSELSHHPDDAILIGDSEYDLAMANNAGVKSIAVTYGVHSMEQLQQHNPLVFIDDIADLLKHL